ncbi:prolyl oligopeptidase family serine peptidase [Lonepinella sp. MS14435]|uniref:prolyl oligopeptidase family serine peptidase n=1 Tax=Lonepinella sp. MS14435 TaxID=3003618 RepID=UPI0036DDBE0E
MKKLILTSVACAMASTAYAQIESVTAVTTPNGLGQRITQAVVNYPEKTCLTAVKKNDFSVTNRTITEAKLTEQKCTNQVVLELDPQDADAATTEKDPNDRSAPYTERNISLTVKQVNSLASKSGKVKPSELTSSKVINQVVDDFQQAEFKDESGVVVKYNLFVPKNYDPNKAYPLVMFIHDAGSTNSNVKHTLLQGNGATSFASPSFQAKHEAFVLAPQFDHQIVNDKSEDPADLEPTINLIKSLATQYNIDQNRLYTTGQSGGAMMSIAMNIKHPDFFAASYIVAGQWEPSVTAPMAKNNIFVLVSENDVKAFPTENEIMKVLTANGANVQESHGWNAQDSVAELNKKVNALLAQGGNIHYASFTGGTLPMEQTSQSKGAAHMGTWGVAYNIDAIKEWLFSQRKNH